MSETVKPTIAALRAWLKTCPLIADEQEATGAASTRSSVQAHPPVWVWMKTTWPPSMT